MKIIIKMISFISYWFFLWFILFIMGIIKANPLIFLLISLIFILTQIIYLYINNTNTYNLTKYIIINMIIKIIPIYILISYYPISINYDDISFGLLLIVIYIITMIILKIDVIKSYNRIIRNYIDNNEKDKTEISKLYDYYYNNLKIIGNV